MARTNQPWLSLFCLCLVGLAAAHGFSHRPQEHQPFVMPEDLSDPDEEPLGSFWGSADNLPRDGAELEIMAPKQLQYQTREGAWAGRRGGAPAAEATSLNTAAKDFGTAIGQLASAVGHSIVSGAMAPVHFALDVRRSGQEKVAELIMNYATALCEKSCPMAGHPAVSVTRPGTSWRLTRSLPPTPWLCASSQLSSNKALAALQSAAVKLHIKTLYAAASISLRLGLAHPQAPPKEWIDERSGKASTTSDACTPVSFLLSAYRGVMALQCMYFALQALLFVLLMIQLWHGWNDDDDESDDEDSNVHQNSRDASTQAGGRHCSGAGKVMTARSVGTATEEDVEAGHHSGGAFAVFEYLSKGTSTPSPAGEHSQLTVPLLMHDVGS